MTNPSTSLKQKKPEIQIDAPLTVNFVDRNHPLYKQGRDLAEIRYHHRWQTDDLPDRNDLAIVITLGEEVVGNVNLAIGKPDRLLQSELFFGKEHWQEKLGVCQKNQIAEVSALATSTDEKSNFNKSILKLLVLALQILCTILEIKYLTTIQHKALIQTLHGRYKLPFIENEEAQIITKNIPQDCYWSNENLPKLYYLEPLSEEVRLIVYGFLVDLNLMGIDTSYKTSFDRHKFCPNFCDF